MGEVVPLLRESGRGGGRCWGAGCRHRGPRGSGGRKRARQKEKQGRRGLAEKNRC